MCFIIWFLYVVILVGEVLLCKENKGLFFVIWYNFFFFLVRWRNFFFILNLYLIKLGVIYFNWVFKLLMVN